MLNENGKRSLELISILYDNLLEELRTLCEESREFSIATTKLEESCFFAKKAACIKKENQKDG
jgi:hypothetical protein